ncbi:MAG: nitrilase-related carbon-nitrogen hydrolase, partial [Actinomycetota bacterium]
MAELAGRKPGLVLVPNASPYERSKDDLRFELVKKRALQISAPILYTNMFGGQDDLVFDGGSMAVSSSEELLARAPQFEEGIEIVELELSRESSNPDLVVAAENSNRSLSVVNRIAANLDSEAKVWSALVVGLRDYVIKNGFKSVALGLSGGIDSALVAAIAVDALGRDRVFGISMPSKYSSTHS